MRKCIGGTVACGLRNVTCAGWADIALVCNFINGTLTAIVSHIFVSFLNLKDQREHENETHHTNEYNIIIN